MSLLRRQTGQSYSSGGHLCGVALVTDWRKDFGLPETVVKGGVCKPVELIEAANYNHFEMDESVGNPYGPNGRAVLALMKLTSA